MCSGYPPLSTIKTNHSKPLLVRSPVLSSPDSCLWLVDPHPTFLRGPSPFTALVLPRTAFRELSQWEDCTIFILLLSSIKTVKKVWSFGQSLITFSDTFLTFLMLTSFVGLLPTYDVYGVTFLRYLKVWTYRGSQQTPFNPFVFPSRLIFPFYHL